MPHQLTYDYLGILMSTGNLPLVRLEPGATWEALGIADDGIMRALAIRFQRLAGRYSQEARISPPQIVAAKDVGGGLMLTWQEAFRAPLDRPSAEHEINEVRAGVAPVDSEVVVTSSRKAKRKKAKSKARKKAKKKPSTSRAKRVRRTK